MGKKGMITQVVCTNVTIAGAGVPVFNYYGPFLIERGVAFSVLVESAAGTSVTLDINYAICTSKDGTYFVPSGASLIFTALATTADPTAASFTPIASPWLKIGIKNKHAATSVTGLTVKLIIQEEI